MSRDSTVRLDHQALRDIQMTMEQHYLPLGLPNPPQTNSAVFGGPGPDASAFIFEDVFTVPFPDLEGIPMGGGHALPEGSLPETWDDVGFPRGGDAYRELSLKE